MGQRSVCFVIGNSILRLLMKGRRRLWGCCCAWNFFGWESEKVVVVTTGTNWALVLMERAKNIVVLCEPFCRILISNFV